MNAESTREALDVASLAGDILLASGAEIFRVEETIDRIARAYGVDSSDAFVLSSGIFLTAESGKKQEFARVRHIPLSAARLDKVTAVNQLSREIEEGLHMPKEAKAWLLDIQRMPDKPRWHQVLASGYRISPCLRYKQWIPFRCIFFTYPFKIRKVYIRSKNIYAFCNISPYFFISRYRSS